MKKVPEEGTERKLIKISDKFYKIRILRIANSISKEKGKARKKRGRRERERKRSSKINFFLFSNLLLSL